MVNHIRSKKSGSQATYFQPLSLLDLEVYINPGRDIQRVKEYKSAYLFESVPFDVKKMTITLFLAEIFYKVLREEEANPPLYEFLFHAIQLLDTEKQNYSAFHIFFLVHLTRYLGFFPNGSSFHPASYFDLKSGEFTSKKPSASGFVSSYLSALLYDIIIHPFTAFPSFHFALTEKRRLMEHLLDYYSIHSEGFGKVKSFEVLTEVFHE